jgi:hypothetical protein
MGCKKTRFRLQSIQAKSANPAALDLLDLMHSRDENHVDPALGFQCKYLSLNRKEAFMLLATNGHPQIFQEIS